MNHIYMDNAATSLPKPAGVAEAVYQAINTLGNAGRGLHTETLQASRTIYKTRVQLARLFHVNDPARIAFTANATESLNIAIYGCLQAGDHVITTAAEHNSLLRPLYDLEDRGLELTILPCDKKGRYSYEDMEAAIQANTKAILCCHGSNLTGNLFDLHRIGQIAQKYQLLFIVDSAQTAGVHPIDVAAMHIDILCFTGHKGLLGPQGTGGIYVRPGLQLRPLKQGGSGVQTYKRTHPVEMPTALEAGTLNGHGIAGLHAALSYIEERGLDAIRQAEEASMWYLYDRLCRIEGVRIYGDFSKNPDGTPLPRCPIISFNIAGYDSAEVGDILYNEYGISTRTGGHCAPRMHEALGTKESGAVRVSLSHYNTREELDCLLEAIADLADVES